MRRLLTMLMILLVVLIAGLSALVLLVNPNDFRAKMVHEVEARSGYQLRLDGPLRWHVWPQLSILSGRMSLTAPGASQPLVSADNMRLDVMLWPLLSHQLDVRQVMLKGAVLQLTPDSKAKPPQDAPVGPSESITPPGEEARWSWDINRLSIIDSVLVFQRGSDEQITVRDINLAMAQDKNRRATLEISGRINRDQRDLTLALSGTLDASAWPENLNASITQLDWQLQGANVPASGITGSGSFQAQWREPSKTLAFSQLTLTANDSRFTGEGSVALGNAPRWALNLNFDSLNLENLLVNDAVTNARVVQQGQQATVGNVPPPIIASDARVDSYQALRGFSAALRLKANSVRWRGLNFTDVNAVVNNARGLLTIAMLNGRLGNGHLSLPGKLDVRDHQPSAAFRPVIANIEIGDILHAFHYPMTLTGNFSLTGAFSGDRIDAEAFRSRWRGDASVTMTNARMEGLNFQQLVQQAIERNTRNVQAQQDFDNATTLKRFTSTLRLDSGRLQLNAMHGESSMLALDGSGWLDLVKAQCDTLFNVQVRGGWQGDSALVERLRNLSVPLRVYGSWDALKYNLDANNVLRKQLQDEAKRRLNDWVERNKESDRAKELKKLLDKQ